MFWPAPAWAARNASERVQASKAAALSQVECEMNIVACPSLAPCSRLKRWKPGTSARRLSRVRQISMNSASRPAAMRKRFMAMNMGKTPWGVAQDRYRNGRRGPLAGPEECQERYPSSASTWRTTGSARTRR